MKLYAKMRSERGKEVSKAGNDFITATYTVEKPNPRYSGESLAVLRVSVDRDKRGRVIVRCRSLVSDIPDMVIDASQHPDLEPEPPKPTYCTTHKRTYTHEEIDPCDIPF